MNQYDTLKLDNQICFSLYACAKEIIRLYKPYLSKLGLTYTQYLVLLVLWESNEITVKDLGERLYLDSGTLTPLLKKMEAKGLIGRARSGKDERKIYVSLTEEGLHLKEAALEIPQKLFCDTHLTMEEAVGLKQSLSKLLGNIT